MTKEVTFEPVGGQINDRIDDAYRAKYAGSQYLKPMIGERAAPQRCGSYPRPDGNTRGEFMEFSYSSGRDLRIRTADWGGDVSQGSRHSHQLRAQLQDLYWNNLRSPSPGISTVSDKHMQASPFMLLDRIVQRCKSARGLYVRLFAILVVCMHLGVGLSQTSNTVKAPDGTFVGLSTATGRQFYGVPYAQAPMGALRWAPPKSLPASSKRIMVQQFGSDCVQPVQSNNDPHPGIEMRGSEDCLFLNIYSPLSKTKHKPVMVWIHGGAFIFGSGRETDPHLLAEKNDIIAVTLNYRLGALGFLSHPALGQASGNFGILDQQMALRWVKRNIAAFGGDPNRVTIFGESAGGVSVCMQVLSPDAKGLFSRAIDESGPCKVIARSIADKRGITYAKEAGCPTGDSAAIDCLRRIPAEAAAAFSSGPVGLGDTAWQPTFGTSVIPKDGRALETGEFNRVPIINGSNRDEGRLFATTAVEQLPTERAYEKNLNVQFEAKANAVLALYPVRAYDSIPLAYAQYMTDWLFACPALRANKAMSHFTTVYAYEFNDENAPINLQPPAQIGKFGASHTSEIQYIVQTKAPSFADPSQFTSQQKHLSDRMQKAWVRFARGRMPSPETEGSWLPVKSEGTPIMNFNVGGTYTVEDFAKRHKCSFWNAQ